MKTRKILLCSAVCMGLAACSPTVKKHGNIIDDYRFEQVVPNVHTRTDVLKIMGSPTTVAPFDENLWYYIGQKSQKKGILDPKVIEERIVTVRFDKEGVVQSIQDQTQDRIAVPLAREQTKTHGNDSSIVQELFGNLGRFNTRNVQN